MSFARIVVQVFGGLILVMSLLGLIRPQALIGVVGKVASSTAGLGFAVGVRIVLGAALLTAAQVSSFPRSFTVLGWIAIAAALGLLILGRGTMRRTVAWVGGWPAPAIRGALVLAVLFGAFLVFGA